jgi:hypothetical protein
MKKCLNTNNSRGYMSIISNFHEKNSRKKFSGAWWVINLSENIPHWMLRLNIWESGVCQFQELHIYLRSLVLRPLRSALYFEKKNLDCINYNGRRD